MKCTVRVVLFWLILSVVPASAHNVCDPDVLLRGLTPEQKAYSTNLLRAADKPKAQGPALRLKVATWNLNLLNVRGWRAPFYKFNSRRLEALLDRYFAIDTPDVVFLQEVWSERDRQTVRLAAGAHNYEIVEAPPVPGRRDGLQILLRKGTIATVESRGFNEFDRQRVLYEMVGAVRRGLLWVRVRLKDGQTVIMGNTHFTAFDKYSEVRVLQIDELKRSFDELKKEADSAVIGGDLNIAADFKDSPRFARQVAQLRQTRWLYSYFAEATGLRDIFRAVDANSPGYTFNSLFNGGLERRLDYLWAGELTGGSRTLVLEAEQRFTDAIDGVHVSDHNLVQAVIEFFQVSTP